LDIESGTIILVDANSPPAPQMDFLCEAAQAEPTEGSGAYQAVRQLFGRTVSKNVSKGVRKCSFV
jgi:hypothetical protein